MLISHNGEIEKADNSNAKMNSLDLNNADAIREKTNSLNAHKINNINNFKHINCIFNEKDKNFCNDELKKHVSILFIILFLLTFLGSVASFCFITFTNKFNEGIVENLVLKNNTKTMEWWLDSPIQPLIKIHIFNYTNIEDYVRGIDSKIRVEEVGPYVYKEYGTRVNLQFTDDYKITFNDNKTLLFMPNLSKGRESDRINVPNVPLLAALGKSENLDAFTNFGLDGFLSMTSPKEFQFKTVDEFLFGYTDAFILSTPGINPDRIGLLAGRRGLSVDNLTVYTGEDSLDNLGRIHAMNGVTKLDIWDSDECNEIVGTDGSQFPPHLMDKEEELQIFIKSFCRTLKLKYEREVTVLNGIPAWRYKTPEGGFSSSLNNPDNKCYCDASNETAACPPDGVFDASKCVDGIPLLISYPHFLEGEPSLLSNFEGLNPDRKKHETFADIHPRMAFPIGGASRLQMNFRVKSRSYGFLGSKKLFTKFPKDLVLPVFWFEVTSGEIPPEFQTLVFHTTQSANATYLAIQYGSLVGAFVSLLLLISTSYIYFMRLVKRPNEKIQNKDSTVATVSFKPNSSLYPQLE